MANAKKVGTLIKKARTDAGLTQEQLAKKVTGASAADIGTAERGEKELTTDQLKQVAKATGVTQKSLLDAAKGKQTVVSASTGTATNAKTSTKLTADEKKLVELYRKADDSVKSKVMELLEKEENCPDISKLRAYLETIGDCVVVVDDEKIIKVHVHTDNPGNAIRRLRRRNTRRADRAHHR